MHWWIKIKLCSKSWKNSLFHHLLISGTTSLGIEFGSRQKIYKCTYCSKLEYSRAKLIRHERTHTGERPFKCNICLKAFTRKETVRTHIASMHADKQWLNQCRWVWDRCYKNLPHIVTLWLRQVLQEFDSYCNIVIETGATRIWLIL